MSEPRMVPVNRVRAVLREHWLSGIVCDHETQTDTAACYCCQWRSPVLESPVAAAHAWIDHVIDKLLGPEPAEAAAGDGPKTLTEGASK